MKSKFNYSIVLTVILIAVVAATPQPSSKAKFAPVVQAVPAVTLTLGSEHHPAFQLVEQLRNNNDLNRQAADKMRALSMAYQKATTDAEKMQIKMQMIQLLDGLVQQGIARAQDAANALQRSLDAQKQLLVVMQNDRKQNFVQTIDKGLTTGTLPVWLGFNDPTGRAESVDRMNKFHDRFIKAQSSVEKGAIKLEVEQWLNGVVENALAKGNLKVQWLQKKLDLQVQTQRTLTRDRQRLIQDGVRRGLATGQLPDWAAMAAPSV